MPEAYAALQQGVAVDLRPSVSYLTAPRAMAA